MILGMEWSYAQASKLSTPISISSMFFLKATRKYANTWFYRYIKGVVMFEKDFSLNIINLSWSIHHFLCVRRQLVKSKVALLCLYRIAHLCCALRSESLPMTRLVHLINAETRKSSSLLRSFWPMSMSEWLLFSVWYMGRSL